MTGRLAASAESCTSYRLRMQIYAYCGAVGSMLDPDAPESAKQVEAETAPSDTPEATDGEAELEPATEPDTAAAE